MKRFALGAILSLIGADDLLAESLCTPTLRAVEFSGRQCVATCLVLHKQIRFVGNKILFGSASSSEGVVFTANREVDLESDEFNIPMLPYEKYPGSRHTGKASSSISFPTISLNIQRRLLSKSNNWLMDYLENLTVRLNSRCDACDVVEYKITFRSAEKSFSSSFQTYWCRTSQ